jgi:N-acetyl-anhydromuramyl-L-alanine amidase AmpD
MRETVSQLKHIEEFSEKITQSLKEFDEHFPWLRDLRNVVAHFDEYPLGKGNNKNIKKGAAEVAILSKESLSWLGYEIRPADAIAESAKLYYAVRDLIPKKET